MSEDKKNEKEEETRIDEGEIIEEKVFDEKMDEDGCKCEEYKAGWVRAQADYQNLVRETNERRAELVRMSRLQILEDFLPIYTNFRVAFAMDIADGQWEGWKQGIEYIMKQYGDTLKNHGIEEIKTVGEKFDTKLHEAVSEEDGDGESGMIIREISPGFQMGDRVVKVARVVVAK